MKKCKQKMFIFRITKRRVAIYATHLGKKAGEILHSQERMKTRGRDEESLFIRMAKL